MNRTATAALAPKVDSMKLLLQPHLAATMSTGGAAKLVSVPPIETLTNSTPSVAYLSRAEASPAKIRSRSISAASVIAAGSVISEPSSGTSERLRKNHASGGLSGNAAPAIRTLSEANCITGRLAAMTMITNTNIGSAKCRSSR